MCSTSVSSETDPRAEQASRVAILLTTYNGEKYLQDQLDSIAGQTYRNWKLYASDDGSTDSTLDILQRFQRQYGANQVHLFAGPRTGFAQNFLSLIRNPDIHAEYFAFCDQDDVWFAHKLERSVTRLDVLPDNTNPAVYCSRTRLIDEVGALLATRRVSSVRQAFAMRWFKAWLAPTQCYSISPRGHCSPRYQLPLQSCHMIGFVICW